METIRCGATIKDIPGAGRVVVELRRRYFTHGTLAIETRLAGWPDRVVVSTQESLPVGSMVGVELARDAEGQAVSGRVLPENEDA
jgi:hypothetical protein